MLQPMASISVWVAVDDATKDNGCLWMIPGSHKAQKVWDHVQVDDEANLSLNQVVPLSGSEKDLGNQNPCDVELDLAAKQGGRADFNAAQAVPIELKAGQISLHDVFMVRIYYLLGGDFGTRLPDQVFPRDWQVHGSDANRTDKPRRGMTFRCIPSTTTYNRDLSLYPPDMPIFLLNGQPGANDLNVGFRS